MKTPVFHFEAEILTDAPFAQIAARLAELDSPADLRCFRPLREWLPVERRDDQLTLRWRRSWRGSEESGEVTIVPDPKGARLHLEGRLKGWMGFVVLGLLRWRTDRLLDRFVEEL